SVGVIEVDHARRSSGEHLTTLERGDPLPGPRAPTQKIARELVDRHVVAVRPHAELRIVVELAEAVRIPAPCASWITRGGDGYALIEGAEWKGRQRELRHQPPVRNLVVQHDWIAVVAGLPRPGGAAR